MWPSSSQRRFYLCLSLILCPLPEKSLSSLLPIRDYGPSEHSLFQTDKLQFFQPLLLCQMLQSLSPFIGLTPVCWHLLHTGEPSTGPSNSDFPCQSREKGSLPLICYQHFYPMQPRLHSAFLAAKANCRLVSKFVSTWTPRTFLAKLLSRWAMHWVIPPHGQDVAFTLADLQNF